MDRDYSMETERELCFCTGQVNNNDVELAPVSSSTYINSQYYMNFDLNIYSQLNIYEHIGNGTAACFCNVRQYDSTYTIVAGNSMIVSLENYKNELQSICDCLSVPNIGCNVADINYNLGRYGDSLLYNSIFDGGGRYASVVAANGFNEVILNSDSASAAEYLYNRIITVNSDGSVDYAMDVLLEVMARAAENITEAEYAAIAMAYLYMDDTDMTEFIKACMTKTEDIKSDAILGNAFGYMNEDYSEWQLDEGKYEKLLYEMNVILDSNLYMLMTCDSNNNEKSNLGLNYLCNKLVDDRKIYNQRIAMYNALSEIESFRGEYRAEYPQIEIIPESTEYGKAYVVEYKEFKNISTIAAPVYSNLASSTITVSPCLYAQANAIKEINGMASVFTDNFAGGFTTQGVEEFDKKVDFYMEHILSFTGSEILTFTTTGMSSYFGHAQNILTSLYGVGYDYMENLENAQIINEQKERLINSEVYNLFNVDVVRIEFDTSNRQDIEVYPSVGRYTYTTMENFQYYYGDEIDINIQMILNCDEELVKVVTDNINDDEMLEVKLLGGRRSEEQ